MTTPTPDLASRSPRHRPLAGVLVLISVTALTIAGCGGNTGSPAASGAASFVGRASNAVVFIQWTRSGSSLSGSLQEAILKEAEGSGVESSSRTFTGTVDGDGLTLTLNEGLGSTKALVGKTAGNGFTLTYPGAGQRLVTIAFSPGAVSGYNAAVHELEGGRTTSSEQPSSNGGESTTTGTSAHVGPEGAPTIQNYGYKPDKACPSNRTCITSIRWENWGATATGVGEARTCSPGGFDCRSAQVRITYSRPITECGGYRYTRWQYQLRGEPLMQGYIEPQTCLPRAEP